MSATRAAAQAHLLLPLAPFLAIEGATDVVVNRAGVVLVETARGWERHEAPGLTSDALRAMADSIASGVGAAFDEATPMLSATLAGGERVQIVRAPAVASGSISITVRIPPRERLSLPELAARGLFDGWGGVDPAARLVEAVAERQTIVVAGATGTGKTTLMRALAACIPPDERVITIEDTPELALPDHENLVALYYRSESRDDPSDRLRPQALLRSALRMRPDRILLAETRGGEAFDFVSAAMSGHPGGMTSVHAASVETTLERLALLARQDAAARGIEFGDMLRLVRSAVDVVVVLARAPDGRRVTALESVL